LYFQHPLQKAIRASIGEESPFRVEDDRWSRATGDLGDERGILNYRLNTPVN
jgi:hypothetical protein